MDLKQELQGSFKGEIDDDPKLLAPYCHDASIFSLCPKLVVHPKDVEDVQALVKFADAHAAEGVSLTARSAGTDMSGGPLTKSIAVDFLQSFNHLKEIGDGFAVTEPGVYYRDFEKATLEHNLLLPSYPASREICTVGGMAANNSGGEKSLRYGKTENFVEKLQVVLADGNAYELRALNNDELKAKCALKTFEGDLYRGMSTLIETHREIINKAKPDVSKNSAGYYLWNVEHDGLFDLTKLFVGSQGTLGLITEITYRLVKPAKHSKLLVIFLRDLKRLPELITTINPLHPESFESYDDHTLKFAIRYFPDLLKQMGGNAFSLLLRFLPEAKMILTGGFPKQVLLAEFVGDSEAEVDKQLEEAKRVLAPLGLPMRVTKTEQEAQKYWVIRRESFNLLRKHFKKERTVPFIDDFCVKPEVLPEFFPKLYAILDQYHLTLTVVGHMGNGNFHIIPLMDLDDPKTKTIIAELGKRVYDLVFAYGGSMTGEHNDGLIRGPYLKQMFGGEVYALFEQTKRIFDPKNIFNPGKKIDVSMDDWPKIG